MFCVVTVVRVHVLYCDRIRVHVLCCDSGTCTCFVLYCDSGTREKSSKSTALRDHFCLFFLPFPAHSSCWLQAGSHSSKLPCICLATFFATFL